jgi:hypothetical protein
MLKAIETVYDGYRFRSRLEARWAVFFKTLGVKYEYEKEGFELGGDVRYLPDFWLPEQKCWVEIKGQNPTQEEHEKCFELMNCVNPKGKRDEPHVYLFAGDIPLPDIQGSKSSWSAYGYDYSVCPPHLLDFCGWTECPFCHMVDITAGGTIEDLPCRCEKKYIRIGAIDDILGDTFIGEVTIGTEQREAHRYMEHNYIKKRMSFLFWGDTPRLIAAYTAARQARFEHGERG